MALIKFGAVVVDGRNKLGGHVFSKNRGGNYMRTNTTPVNPQTASQQANRAIFGSISSAWSSLDEGDRQSWFAREAQYARTNVFGDLKNPSGKALFQRLNQNLLLAGDAMLDVCPQPAETFSLADFAVTSATTTSELAVTWSNLTLADTLIVEATPPLSPGTSYVKNLLRIISYSTLDATGTFNAWSDYEDQFGTLELGNVIYVSVRTMNANGQKSPSQSVRVVIAA